MLALITIVYYCPDKIPPEPFRSAWLISSVAAAWFLAVVPGNRSKTARFASLLHTSGQCFLSHAFLLLARIRCVFQNRFPTGLRSSAPSDILLSHHRTFRDGWTRRGVSHTILQHPKGAVDWSNRLKFVQASTTSKPKDSSRWPSTWSVCD